MKLEEQLMQRFELHKGKYIAGGEIEKWVQNNTKHTPSYARRLVRLMVEDGKLKQQERPYNGVNHAYYCYDPDDSTVEKPKQYRYEPVFENGKIVAMKEIEIIHR